jgi:hypothetical protein
VVDPGTIVVTSNAFVRFTLRGCGGNQPTVPGVGVLAPTQGSTWWKDFPVNATGDISGTIFSTRDSTGLLGGEISCGGSTLAVWFGMTVWLNGKSGPEVAVHTKNGASLNVQSVVPITVNPVIAAPTGDTTYLRLDAGNGPVTGNLLLNSMQCKNLENIRCIDTVNSQGWAGSDLGAWINAASAVLAGPGHIMVTPGTYTLTTPVVPLSGQQILCSGEGACIVSGTGLAAGNHFFSFASLSDVRISGFTLNGPANASASGTGQDNRGVSCSGCTRLEVDHMQFTSVSYGIAASSDTDSNLHDNWISNIGLEGISAAGNNTQVRNNRISNVGSSNQHHGIYLQNGDGVLTDGNQISNIQGFCIVVQENVAAVTLTNYRVVNNYCKNGGQNGSGSRGGIAVSTLAPGTNQIQGVSVAHNIIDSPGGGNPIVVAAAGNISIDDNIARNYQNDCILISGSGAFNTEAITVTHNKCFNQTVGGNGIRALVGGATTRNVTIADNILDGMFGSCIWVSGLTDSKIHDNRCKDWNIGANAGNAGILVDTSSLRTQVQQNNLSSANCTGSPASIQITGAGSLDSLINGNTLLNTCAGISDAGTRSFIFGNKLNATDTAMAIAPTTVFASLGTPANGTFVYCSDCTIANPCAGAGTGALAKRLNVVWVCN